MEFSFYEHEFTAPIEKHSMGTNAKGELFYTVAFVPNELAIELDLKNNPRLRIEGEINEIPFEGSLHPAKGRWYILLSKRFLNDQKLVLGNRIDVRFKIGDQDHVDVPAELEQALEAHGAALALWESFTPGKKRGFAAAVSSGKQVATREKRAQKMIGYILDGKNPGGRYETARPGCTGPPPIHMWQ